MSFDSSEPFDVYITSTGSLLSAAASITWWSFYFPLYRSLMHAAEIVNFFGYLTVRV